MSQTTKSTNTPTYSADQSALQGSLASTLQSDLSGGLDGLFDEQKAGAVGGLNTVYNGLSDSLTSNLSARGFGQSGKLVGMGSLLSLAGAAGGLALMSHGDSPGGGVFSGLPGWLGFGKQQSPSEISSDFGGFGF